MPSKKTAKEATKKTAKKTEKKTTKTEVKPKKGKKVKQGQAYECGICGFRILVDDCGCVEEHYLICCKETMTQKKAKKTTKKTATKTAKKTVKKPAKKTTKKK
jgi:RNA polymerase primary sigma factor